MLPDGAVGLNMTDKMTVQDKTALTKDNCFLVVHLKYTVQRFLWLKLVGSCIGTFSVELGPDNGVVYGVNCSLVWGVIWACYC